MARTKGKKKYKKIILVDGSNVAFFNPPRKGLGRFGNLQAFKKFLEGLNERYSIQYRILVDASLRHHIDNEQALELEIKSGKIIQCPSQTQADFFILEYFKQNEDNVIVISNDNFSEYDISNLKQCKFVIIGDEIILHPPIEQIWDIENNQLKGEQVNA